MSRANANYLRTLRAEEAVKRQEARDHRTPTQQLALLDSRLGKDQGATKERARLNSEILRTAPVRVDCPQTPQTED